MSNETDQRFNIAFVGEVKKHECLYNFTLPEYTMKDVTKAAWRDIAEKMNMTAAEAKERWRNLRMVYIRKIKPSQMSTGIPKTTYYLADAIDFCLPFIKRKTGLTATTVPIIENNKTINDDNVHSEKLIQALTAPAKKKVNVSVDTDQCVAAYFKAKKAKMDADTSSTNTAEKHEALKMFLLSLMPELQEFNSSQIKTFKRQVFTLIDEIANSASPAYESVQAYEVDLGDPLASDSKNIVFRRTDDQ